MPINGNNIRGNIATTGIGIASVTHHMIISAPTARTIFASWLTLKGFTASIKIKSATPASNAIKSRRLLTGADIDKGIFVKFEQIKVTNKLKKQLTP